MTIPIDKTWTPTYDEMDDLGWLMLDQRAKKKVSRKVEDILLNPNPILRAEMSKFRTGDVILLLEGWKEESIKIKCPKTLDGPIEEYEKVFKTPITRKVVFLEFDWEHERIKYQTEAGDSVGTVDAGTVWKKVSHIIGIDIDENIHVGGDGGDEEAKGVTEAMYPNVVGKIYLGQTGSWAKFKFRVLSQLGEKLRVVVLEGPIKNQINKEFGLRRSTFDTCKEVVE